MSLLPQARPLSRGAYLALLALIGALAFFARVRAGDHVVEPERLWISDNDTLRRLVRLEQLTSGEHAYPFVERADGSPEGSVLHWTLPMDGVLLVFDRALRPLYPQARAGEAGAIWAGPILGTSAVLLFGVLIALLLAPAPALCATVCYAFASTAIGVGPFGNGDHQSLQHLALVGALLGYLALLAQRGGRAGAVGVGLSLGIALWVSTESQAVLLLMGAASFAQLALAPTASIAPLASRHRTWALAASAVVFGAGWIEHGQPFACSWDQVSALQLHALAIFVLFLALVPSFTARCPLHGKSAARAILASAVVAVLLGALPWLVPACGDAFRAELASFGSANRWVQAMVSEYRPLLQAHGHWYLGEALERFTPAVLALPLLLLALLRHPLLSVPGRVALVVLAGGTFGLGCYEVKLAHFFQILWPLVLTVGGMRLLAALPLPARGPLSPTRVAAASALLVIAWSAWHLPRGSTKLSDAQIAQGELMEFVRELRGAGPDPKLPAAVLAPWSLGAPLLYEARKPVVASGYHRNLAGIHDGIRAFLATGGNEIEPILQRRNVRWLIVQPKLDFFAEVSAVLPELPRYASVRDVRFGPGRLRSTDFELDWDRIEPTILFQLGFAPTVRSTKNARLLYESRAQLAMPPPLGTAPAFRDFELELSNELGR
jgi:hypothetical protein